jgi:hypothetical protein
MPKLTLNVDARVVAQAKRYAASRGTSVSRIVERMLDVAAAGGGADNGAPTPVLNRLRGSLRRGTVADYRRYLARKYR